LAKQWSLKLLPQADKQLRIGSKNAIAIKLSQRMRSRWASISQGIGTMLSSVLETSEVISSLRGGSSVDLPAHLGLTDQLAAALADGMVNMMHTGIIYNAIRSGEKFIINIQAVPRAWEAYRSLPGGEYISVNRHTGTSIVIPVAQWMLVNPNLDIGQLQYSILFAGDTARDISTISRSGRAIMVKIGTPESGEPYFLPGILQQKLGKNFIEYVIGQPQIAIKVMNFVIQKLISN
jgi:hypothetical protein